MSVIAPPEPRPDELGALIEEARERARRRRFAYSSAALLAAGVAAGVSAAIVFTRGGGSTAPAVPAGYHLVQARGPVAHATITQYPPVPTRVVEIATGRERSAPLVLEVWWDERSGFDRVVGRIDGRVEFDTVGQTCQGAPGSRNRFCIPPAPFDLERIHYRWPIDPNAVRVVGHETFRGDEVIWLEALVNGRPPPPKVGDRVALDARTHRPVVRRTFDRGRLLSQEVYSVLNDLPGKRVSFVVPDGGAARHSFPPFPTLTTHSATANLARARTALGAVPLWLGPRFRGRSLRSVEIGGEVSKAPNGAVLRRTPFVLLDYGTVALREYGRVRPYGFLHGPRPGRMVLDGRVMLSRGGLLVFAQPVDRRPPVDRDTALALAGALRPVPGP